jgi:hypothetical protein
LEISNQNHEVNSTEGWRKLHNDELHNLYSSPRVIRMIRPRMKGWAGHVARMEVKRNACRVLVGKLEKKTLGRPKCRWKIILKWILEKLDGVIWTGFILLRIGASGRRL